MVVCRSSYTLYLTYFGFLLLFKGCDPSSSTFGFLTHSDEFNPEIMQATSGLVFDNIGRKFRFSRTDIDTVSGRTQNWFDADGSTSGFNEPTLIGSGLSSAGLWWTVGELYLSPHPERLPRHHSISQFGFSLLQIMESTVTHRDP
jgi:hypothetical protein